MTPDERRRIEILEEFARFLPSVSLDMIEQGVRIRPAPERDTFAASTHKRWERAATRDARAKRAAQPPPAEIIPLPRLACPVCGMTYGTLVAVMTHRARSHH